MTTQELSREEIIIVEKYRKLGPWGRLTVHKQNGLLDSIENSDREKIPRPQG